MIEISVVGDAVRNSTFSFEKKVRVIDLLLHGLPAIPINVIGVDPGTRHWGLALVAPSGLSRLFELEFERGDTTNARLENLKLWMSQFSSYLPFKMIVEGPSFADRYRQVELEDIRAGLVCLYGDKVEIVSPSSIRKVVFGTAKVKSAWGELPSNASAALACALYGVIQLGS